MWVTLRGHDGTDSVSVKINTDFIIIMWPEENKVELSSGKLLTLSKEGYNELEKTMFPKRKSVSKDDTDLAEFLNELHRLTGGKGPALLSPKRKKALNEILAIQDMTREKLILAATNVGKDAFLQGDNDKNKRWGDIDYLLRPDKAVKWAEYKPEDKRKKLF